MRSPLLRRGLVAAALAATAATGALLTSGSAAQTASAPTFSDPGTIDNPYLPLTASKRCELRGTADDGTRERSVKTVQPGRRTFIVSGRRVATVIVKDDAYEDGELVESTLDYFAQADDGTVHYFGESVRNLRRGKLVDTKGTWLYGKDTDRLGVAMPAKPALGQQYRFEDVPGITVESNRVEETGLRAEVRGRVVGDVIRIQEFIQPEGDVEYKTYAPGIGVIDEYPPDGHVRFAGCR